MLLDIETASPAKPTWPLLRPIHVALFVCTLSQIYGFRGTFTPSSAVLSDDPKAFNASHANEMLSQLANLGIRTVGSRANEVLAVEMLMERLRGMKEASIQMGGVVSFEFEIQHGSGFFHKKTLLDGFTQAYQGVTNVVARIGPPAAGTTTVPQNAVLVNAHFDSGAGKSSRHTVPQNCCCSTISSPRHISLHLTQQGVSVWVTISPQLR